MKSTMNLWMMSLWPEKVKMPQSSKRGASAERGDFILDQHQSSKWCAPEQQMVRTRTTNGAQQNNKRCAPIPARAPARLSAELGFDEGFAFVAELEGEEVAALVKGAEEELVPFPSFIALSAYGGT